MVGGNRKMPGREIHDNPQVCVRISDMWPEKTPALVGLKHHMDRIAGRLLDHYVSAPND